MDTGLLHQIPLFASLSESDLEQLSCCLQLIELPDQAILFTEGDPGDRFYAILSGQVKITKALDSTDSYVLNVRGPGEFIGEMSLFDPQSQRSATARALGPLRLLELYHARFQELLQTHPALGYYLVRELTLRLRQSDNAAIQDLREKNRLLSLAYEELKAAQAQLVEKEKLERELQVARRIQQSMLPASLPTLPGFNFGALMLPARAVGGDLFDFVPLTRDRLGIMVGDVSDKGVPAALFMALARSLLRAEAQRTKAPAEVLRRVNRHLLEMSQAGQFITLIYGVLDRRTGQFAYARAGHELPLLFDRQRQRLPVPMNDGMMLGIFPDISIDEQTISIPPGGALFLHSDGATDAINAAEERFGAERLLDAIQSNLGGPAQSLCQAILARIQAYHGATPQADDITMLAISSEEG